ncbi:hypothetical protein T440DRAFT_175165 [Plenodomus tracheiphilus IPT5]|uniref:CorA-like transporter domain-containing protein n=1 Tax=Plenodomus tracheiphilus IPT5 TaxID=1408161 RepID=A0A6A7AYB4_9PLEO|nr:hypothetical protein T440DRAFT_175165 [Plenodomus tracheiphilus IPT5]
MIPQIFSWGQLQISQETMQAILAYHQIFPPFLRIMAQFGPKIRQELPGCNPFHSYRHTETNGTNDTEEMLPKHHNFEIAYTLQFMEKNNRNRGDPWSLRQTGIYQQTTSGNHQSTWIFLHMSQSARMVLEKAIREHLMCLVGSHSPMTFHGLLIEATMSNWVEYVQNLDAQLRNLDEKACFAKIGAMRRNDYCVSCSDIQKLQKLKQKILTTSLALRSCLDVAIKLREQTCTLEEFENTTKSSTVRGILHTYCASIRKHQQSTKMMIERLQGTFDLLSNIIQYRSIEDLRSISKASEKHMEFLNEVTMRIRNDNQASAVVVSKTHQDAKTMKALTITATSLFPASLIATIFSSSLVQVKQDSDSGGQSTRLVVADQFWIYVVITLAATMITLGCTRLLQH